MKIKRHPYKSSSTPTHMSFQEFADKYNLTLHVFERDPLSSLKKYYVYFESVEIKDRNLLISAIGNGDTETEAVIDFARQISDKLIVIDAYASTRKQIQVPKLTVASIRFDIEDTDEH